MPGSDRRASCAWEPAGGFPSIGVWARGEEVFARRAALPPLPAGWPGCGDDQLDGWQAARRLDPEPCLWSCKLCLHQAPRQPRAMELRALGWAAVVFQIEPGPADAISSGGRPVAAAAAVEAVRLASWAGLQVALEISLSGEAGDAGMEALFLFLAAQQGASQRVARICLGGSLGPRLDELLPGLLEHLNKVGLPVDELVGPGATAARREAVRFQASHVREAGLAGKVQRSGQAWLAVDPLGHQVHLLSGERPLLAPPGMDLWVMLDGLRMDAASGRWCPALTPDGELLLECVLPVKLARLLLTAGPAPSGGLRLAVEVQLERPAALGELTVLLHLAPRAEGQGPGSEPLEIRQVRPDASRLVRRQGQVELTWSPPTPGGAPAPGLYKVVQAMELGTAPGLRARGAGREDDFALVICPPWETRMPPLWPAMLVSHLRAAGLRGACHDVNNQVHRGVPPGVRPLWEMVDFFAWQKEGEFRGVLRHIGEAMEQAAQRVLVRRPQVVGLTTTLANLRASLHLATRLKEVDPAVKVVLGGPGVFWTTEGDLGTAPNSFNDHWSGKPLDPGGVVDVVARGEADLSIVPLFRALLDGADPLQVPGALARRGGIWQGSPPEPPEDLDALPLPDYSDLDLDSFKGAALPLLTSRGCIRGCAFCNDCRMQGSYRRRSAEHIFHEVRHLHRRFGVRHFSMVDLLINGDLAQLERFSQLILEAGIHVSWGGQAIIDPAMTPALLDTMFRAGCRDLTFGIESFSQETVDAMDKRFDVGDALRVLHDASAAGICTAINLLVGFPGESPEGFEETLMALDLARDFIGRIQAINATHLTVRSRLWQAPARYGVHTNMPEPWYRWTGPRGNTYEVRKERLRRLVERATSLGLRPNEQNLYDERAMRISGAELVDHAGAPRASFRPGEEVNVLVRYDVLEPVQDPLFRVQVLRSGDDLLVYGHNTGRAGLSWGVLCQGRGTAALRLESLNLAPGEYHVTVGVWPDEASKSPYDVRHGSLNLRVDGEVHPDRPLVDLDVAVGQDSSEPPGASLDFGQPEPPGPPPELGQGEALEARMAFDAPAGAWPVLDAWLMRGGLLVHQQQLELPRQGAREPGGRSREIRLRYRCLPLIRGTYRLAADIRDAATGEVLFSGARPIRVAGGLADGGGVVLHRAVWRLEHLPDRPPEAE